MVIKENCNSTKEFCHDPMPGHEYLTIGRAAEILDSIQGLADAYAYSSTDRVAINELIGKVLLGWSMEFRLRKGEYIRTADMKDTQSPNS